jgi:hypothetical protein
MTERIRNTKSGAKKTAPRPGRSTGVEQEDGESAVKEKIAAMPEPFRSMGERLHAIIKASGPALAPKLWYGMPGYAKDAKCVCFFRADKYMTLGFTQEANLFDEGAVMQPSAYALRELTGAEEARIGALVKKAVS